MKRIEVFECDYCSKLYRSKSAITRHEKRCFSNPETHSCITCQYLSDASLINGIELTDKEYDIISFKVDGTYDFIPIGDMERFPILKPEYTHLLESEGVTFCRVQNLALNKLKTACNFHKSKITK